MSCWKKYKYQFTYIDVVCLFFIKLQDISADTVMDAFQGWISMVCSVEVPLVLCSGTLLSFDAQG